MPVSTINSFDRFLPRFCSSCGNSLPPGQNIPAKEMDELADTFSKKVFIRNNDAFINSDPEEVGNFKAFLASRPKYDVVVDAMNVLFRKRNSTFAEKDWIVGRRSSARANESFNDFVSIHSAASQRRQVLLEKRQESPRSLSLAPREEPQIAEEAPGTAAGRIGRLVLLEKPVSLLTFPITFCRIFL